MSDKPYVYGPSFAEMRDPSRMPAERRARALEAATGCDLIIDDTPDVVTMSSFDPVRREIGRLALSRLVSDGRIHPARIEEQVTKATKEIDAVIKRAGENIAASEVETVIREHPGVFDCAVIGIPDAIRDEAILAVVVASDGTAVTAEDITAWCQQRLAHFRVPQFVRFRSKLPRTAVGKIQKHILRQELQP